jgi:hypothetical protein
MEKLTQVSADIILCPASTISFVADSTKSTVKPDGPYFVSRILPYVAPAFNRSSLYAS